MKLRNNLLTIVQLINRKISLNLIRKQGVILASFMSYYWLTSTIFVSLTKKSDYESNIHIQRK